MEKKKIALITIVVFVVGLIITGASYAFWSWSSNVNKNVVFNVASNLKNYIVYNEGESAFTGELRASNNYQTNSIHSTISIYKTTNVSLLATIHMDINRIGSNMKQSTALKWVVTEGTSSNPGTVLAKGNFIGTNNEDVLTLVPDLAVNITETFYTIWIWLDASQNPSNNLTGETLDTNVWVEVNQVEGAEDRYEVTHSDSNYQQVSATVVDSKYKVTHYAITTTEDDPSSWTTITPSTDQAKVYNLNETTNNTGTYYIWFKDENGRITHTEVEVSAIDETAPSCSWGAFTPVKIADGETSSVTFTCTDMQSGIQVHNLTTADFTPANNKITVTNVTKESVTNGYKYTITVTGTANDGTSYISIAANKVKDGVGLGNASSSSGDVIVENIVSVSDAVVTLEYNSTTYDGSAKTPSVTVVKNGVTLTLNTDYTVSYSNNTNVGTATVTITGTGNYGGTTTRDFTIAYNSFNITLDNANATTNGTSTLYMRYADGVYLDSNYANKMTTSANPITIPVRTGYSFAGYYDNTTQLIDATGKITSAFTNTKYSAAKTLNAHWTANTYTVTANAGSGSIPSTTGWTGTGTEATKTVTYDSTYGTLPTPTRTGYTFDGWYTASTGGTEVTSAMAVTTASDHTIYAHWTANTYIITLDNSDATTDGTSTLYFRYDDGVYLDNSYTNKMTTSANPITIPQRTGYSFAGYYDNTTQLIDATGKITSAFTNTKYTAAKTLNAHWIDSEAPTISPVTRSVIYSDFSDWTLSGATIDGNGYLSIASTSDYAYAYYEAHNVNWDTNYQYMVPSLGSNETSRVIESFSYYTNDYTEISRESGWRAARAVPGVTGAGTWHDVNIENQAATTAFYTKTNFYWSSTYVKMPYKIRNFKFLTLENAKSQGKYITLNAADNSSGVKTIKWLSGSHTVSDFASSGTVITNGFFEVTTAGTYTIYVEDNVGNAAVYPLSITNIDRTAPTANITSTNTVTTSQTVTLTCNDASGVNGYYWGTTAPSGAIEYTYITATTSMSVTKTVNAAGTYYLVCKDIANNRSTVTSKTFYKTTLNMTNGTVSPTSVITMSGNSFRLPTPTASSGYTTKGNWYTNSGLTTGAKAYASSYTPSSTTTLYSGSTANTYTVDFEENLFDDVETTGNGVTISYDMANSAVTIDGTPTGTSFSFGRLYDKTITVGDTYRITMNKISGSYSSTVTPDFVLTFQKDSVGFDGSTGNVHYKVVGMPSADSNSNSITTTSAVSGANTLYYWFWHSTANATTFNNYKVQILITKVSTKSVTYASTYGTLPTPTKPGFTFAGWYTAVSGGTQVTSSTTVSTTSNHKLYARWTKATYTLNANANGGSIPTTSGWTIDSGSATASKSVTFDNTYGTLPTPTKTGYDFTNWKNIHNYGNTSLSAGTANYKYFRAYENVKPGVTYNVTMTSAQITSGSATQFTTLIYDFTSTTTLSSSVNSFGSDISYKITCPSTADRTHDIALIIYAGIAGSTTGNEVTYSGVKINSTVINSSYNFTSSSYVRTPRNHDLVAAWTAKTITIQYNKNTTDTVSSMPSSSTTYTYSESGTTNLASNTPTRTGYTFLGWSTSSSATSASYAAGASWSRSNIPNSGTTYTLYAVWRGNVLVTFDPNGGSVSPTSKYVAPNSTYGTLPTPTKSGKTFTGWEITSRSFISDKSSLRQVAYDVGVRCSSNGNCWDEVDDQSDDRGWSYSNANWQTTLSAGKYRIVLNFYEKITTNRDYCGLSIYPSSGSAIIHIREAMYNVSYYETTFTLSSSKSVGIMVKGYDSIYRLEIFKVTDITSSTTLVSNSNHTITAHWS